MVSPGDVITRDQGYMRGHGTYIDQDVLWASIAGIVERVNKLISMKNKIKIKMEKCLSFIMCFGAF